MEFKKWVKSIQTAGYNGARRVLSFVQHYDQNWYIKKNYGRILLSEQDGINEQGGFFF